MCKRAGSAANDVSISQPLNMPTPTPSAPLPPSALPPWHGIWAQLPYPLLLPLHGTPFLPLSLPLGPVCILTGLTRTSPLLTLELSTVH
jgi:hypothetical protein